MFATWGAAIWTILTTSWFWITLAVVGLAVALVVVIAVEVLTRERTTPLAAILRAVVAVVVSAVVAPAVFYGIQRVVEAPERVAQAQREQKNDALLTDVAARVGNQDAAKELIDLRARALFGSSTGDAERFADQLLTQLSEKKVHHKALKDESAKEAMRRRLDWEPFLRAFLEQFDQRVAALQSRNIELTVSTNEVPLMQPIPSQRLVVRDLQVAGRYRLRVHVNTGEVDFGKLASFPSFSLVGTMEGDADQWFISIYFDSTQVTWELGVGRDHRRAGSQVVGRDVQTEEYRLAVRDGLNFAFEYAVLFTTK